MAEQALKKIIPAQPKPILKWAGGKTQMLGDLIPKVPTSYGRYIEPFLGGGAMFFALQPENAVIADSNPELINMYRQVADHVDEVINFLRKYENTSEMFYAVRSLDWTSLPKAEAAARTIYLNKTCFNGLYRVNKQGQFNVPFGKYKNPKICDEDGLRAASEVLKKVDAAVLAEGAKAVYDEINATVNVTVIEDLYKKGYDSFTQGKYEEAKTSLKKVVDLNASHDYAQYYLARCYEQLNDDGKATVESAGTPVSGVGGEK